MNAARLHREVEIRAERTLSLIRMGVALLLGVLAMGFFVAVSDAADEVVLRQLVFAAASMVAYFLIGAGAWWMATPSRFKAWAPWVLTTLDVAFMLFMALVSAANLGLPWDYLGALPAFTMFSLVLSFAALRFNPLLAAYAVGLVTLATLVVSVRPRLLPPTVDGGLGELFGGPANLGRVVILLLTGAVLVVVARRSRRILERAIAETRRRANLTRYLPSELTRELSELADAGDIALRQGRRQHAALLFVDIRGFTALAEALPPEAVGQLVADYRRRITEAASATGGVIDKFIGDGAFVVFGLPQPGPDDAARALICARAILSGVALWNLDRAEQGLAPIAVGIGVHVGEIYCGAVGDDSRLEFAVLGDAVNVAARLEQATKQVGLPLLVTAEAIAAAGEDPAAWIALPDQILRGREASVTLYGLALPKDAGMAAQAGHGGGL